MTVRLTDDEVFWLTAASLTAWIATVMTTAIVTEDLGWITTVFVPALFVDLLDRIKVVSP